jgi:CspA family cold shock protein
MRGRVYKTKTENGYLFINGDNGTSYFAHSSAFRVGVFPQVHEGTVVDFEATAGSKGPRAESVEVVR